MDGYMIALFFFILLPALVMVCLLPLVLFFRFLAIRIEYRELERHEERKRFKYDDK